MAAPPPAVLVTERLRLRHFTLADAEFILGLLNEPSFIRNIGDRGIRTVADAQRYLTDGPIASYARHGYGLYAVEVGPSGETAGMCGLIRRDYLDDADVGFAFLPGFWGQGYACESAAAVMAHGLESLRLSRILAIVSPGNSASIRVLLKLGMRFERMIRAPGDASDIALYSTESAQRRDFELLRKG